MTRAFAIISSCLLLLTACKKNPLPEPATEEPDFFLDCNLGQQHAILEAGNNDYYMNTSCYRDSTSGVYVFKGNLNQPCTGACGYGFAVLINDFTVSAYGAPVDVNNALRVGSYSYNDNELASELYDVQLNPIVKQSSSDTYTWVLTSSSGNLPEQTKYNYTAKFTTGTTYTATLKIESSSGCFTEHSRVFTVGGIQGNITATRTSQTDLVYYFTSGVKDEAGNTYLWNFGDGTTSTLTDPTHTFNLSSGYYQTTLTVTKANNESCTLTYQVPGTMDPICLANFNTSVTPIPKTTVYSRVTVIVTDPSGKKFTTKGFQQPTTSKFFLDEISDYEQNKNMEPTKKLKIRLNCILRSGSEELILSEGKSSIGVAYK